MPTAWFATTLVNPDMVGEFRVILTPVDAETGPRQWASSNRHALRNQPVSRKRGLEHPELRARRQHVEQQQTDRPRRLDSRQAELGSIGIEYTVSLGGPIIKNKTFFFFVVGPAVRARPHTDETCRADGLREERHLPLLGRLGKRQYQYRSPAASGPPIRRSNRSIRSAIHCGRRPIPTARHTPASFDTSAYSVLLLNTPSQARLFGRRSPEGSPWDTYRPEWILPESARDIWAPCRTPIFSMAAMV